MRRLTILIAGSPEPVCHTAWVAEHAHQRLRGLLFRSPLQEGEGLLLLNVRSIHTIGMRYSLDVLFLTSDFLVTASRVQLSPSRVCFGPHGTRHVLELPPGSIQRQSLQPGARLSLIG